MSGFGDLFDNAFADMVMGRMVQPKDEAILDLDRRIANRIRVNEFILLHLRRTAS